MAFINAFMIYIGLCLIQDAYHDLLTVLKDRKNRGGEKDA